MRHQADFVERGVPTLEKLREEIERSTTVFHVIGLLAGATPPKTQVDDFVEKLPDLVTRYPVLADADFRYSVTYTQWEAWLGLYFGKRVCCYSLALVLERPQSDAEVEQSRLLQVRHRDALSKCECWSTKFADEAELCDEVILTLIELGYLAERDAHRPISLPYPSIGELFVGRQEFMDRLRESLQRSGEWQGNRHLWQGSVWPGRNRQDPDGG